MFASSAQTVEAYPEDRQVSVTKCFGEALGSYFATQEGLSVIAVRIANFAKFAPGERHSARDVSDFAIVNGVSNNRYKRLSLDESRDILGYLPEDDAFEILGL